MRVKGHSLRISQLNRLGLLLLFMMMALISIACSKGVSGERLSGYTAGGSIKLTWDAPSTNSDLKPLTDLAGYNIYYWTFSEDAPNFLHRGRVRLVPLAIQVKLSDSGLTCKNIERSKGITKRAECTFTIHDFMLQGFKRGKKYYFAVSAYNEAGLESSQSNHIMKKID